MPSKLPVSLFEAKQHLRVDGDAQDALINRLIRGAADSIEGPNGAGIAMTNQQFDLVFDCFEWCFAIPIEPLVSVDSIKYIDTAGVEQTLNQAVYEVDTFTGRVRPASGQSWPSTKDVFNAVTVRFTCGYDAVPEDLKDAVLLIIGDRFENAEDNIVGATIMELPNGARSIVDRYRTGRFG